MDQSYDFIIIGGGFSGLSFAALISKFGKKVLVIEKNNYIGGRTTTRKANDWRLSNTDDLVSFGPHIFPAKGYLEFLMDYLDIKKNLKLYELELPYFYKDNIVLKPPRNIFNIFSFYNLYRKLEFISFKERISLFSLFLIAFFNSNKDLISKYESLSCNELAEEVGIKSKDGKRLVEGMIGGYCFNDDLGVCPALDLLINIKLAIRGIVRKGTIMYHVGKGYGDVIEELEKKIKENKGDIIKGKFVNKIIVEDGKAKGVIVSNKKIESDNIVVTIDDKKFAKLLEKSKLDYSFLKGQLGIKRAKVVDLIVKAKKRIHEEKTSWVSMLVGGKEWGYVIIDDNPLKKENPIYHICVISHNKKENPKEFVKKITADIKRRFNFDMEKDVMWKKIIEIKGYGSEKNVSIPFSQRVGPKTPYNGLYCIGDSYKALTTGTDGCAYSVMDLIEKLTGKDFNLDKRLNILGAEIANLVSVISQKKIEEKKLSDYVS